MAFRLPSSRRRYRQYKTQLRARQTEGSRGSPDGAPPPRRRRSFVQLFRFFLSMVRPYRRTVIVALLLLAVATALSLIPPYGTKIVFDHVLDQNPLPQAWTRWIDFPDGRTSLLIFTAVTMVAIELVAIVIGMTSRWMATRTTKRLQMGVRRIVFGHAVRLPLHRVYQLKSGGVASLLREDAGGVGDLVFAMLYNPCKAIVRLTGSLIILTLTDWRLLLGSLLLFPTVYLTHRTWIARIRPLWRDVRSTRQGIDGQATEAFGGMRVVRTFGRQRSEAGRFMRGNHFMARQEILGWWWSRGVDIAWAVLIPAALAGLLAYGGWRVLVDQERVAAGVLPFEAALTKGDLVMFVTYLMLLLEPLAVLASSATQFQNDLAGLDRVQDLLEEPLEFAGVAPGRTRLVPGRVSGRVSLRDVCFTYPGSERQVLTGIRLDVEPGQTIALVGPSGSGKTTLCNLVARFYDPTRGSILLDGIDLREIDIGTYRRLLGIVEQDIFLFDGTVAENIGYGRRWAERGEIERAARLAHAHEFVAGLDRGYDTTIGERGVRLSGGQRQRIAIARALLADPRILILDEATSSLDTESERLIQASLRTLMRDRTSFVIAHRLSTIVHADRIVVLDEGSIVEEGTHAELVERSGRYQQMVALQLQDMGAMADGRGTPEPAADYR
jgi:ATP-binding cassette subfamily B protein/subfamily B ATP-binding cassette protein MsbA